MSDSIANDVLSGLGIETSGELKHFGKKGMKWGVRKDDRPAASVSTDHATSRELKAKPRSEMTNAELKKLNERLQLEKTNNELQSRTALQKIKTGTAVAGTILAVGTTIGAAYNFVNSPVGKATANMVKKLYTNG